MPAKPLNQQSKTELLKQVKVLKVAITFSIISMLLLLGAGMWLTAAKHKFSALTVVPFSMGIIVLANTKNLKAVQAELKLRG